MANNNSLFNSTSRYVHGGVTEIKDTRIEWWERNNFAADLGDTIYVVENVYAGRLDNIAAVFYGEPQIWWLIAQYNNVLDPFSEIVPGRILRMPTKERVQTMLTGRKGGIDSKRELEPIISPVVV